ncbi:MAG: hypothetical protein JW863_18780 [Chitinispirillaceae bacterium]|nr:hypothetical protein [Chitinispirillaceae bacterium]
MSDAKEQQFLEAVFSGAWDEAVDQLLGVIDMYATQVNLRSGAADPALEVDDVVENF